mgnify:FL=1
MAWLFALTAIEWWVFSSILLLLGVLVSQVHLVCLGISATLVGVMMFFWPELLAWDHQFGLWLSLFGLMVVVLRQRVGEDKLQNANC